MKVPFSGKECAFSFVPFSGKECAFEVYIFHNMSVGHCVLILYLSQDDLESCRRDTVQSGTPGGAYLICIVFIFSQHPCILLIHKWY